MRYTAEAQAILKGTPVDDRDLPQEAWELIARYRGELLNQAYALLGSLDEAEDAVQETFADAFKDRAKLADVQSIGAWLRSLNKANALSGRRASGRRARREERKQFGAPAKTHTTGGFSLLELRESLAAAIELLPDAHRAVVVLRCWEDLEHEAIAARLKLPVGSVRRLFHEATVMLYDKLRPHDAGPKGGTSR